MAKCKYCGEEKKLIKSHIIPEPFYTKLSLGAYQMIGANCSGQNGFGF